MISFKISICDSYLTGVGEYGGRAASASFQTVLPNMFPLFSEVRSKPFLQPECVMVALHFVAALTQGQHYFDF